MLGEGPGGEGPGPGPSPSSLGTAEGPEVTSFSKSRAWCSDLEGALPRTAGAREQGCVFKRKGDLHAGNCRWQGNKCGSHFKESSLQIKDEASSSVSDGITSHKPIVR